MKDNTIIICSIVRDAAEGLKRNIPVINNLCKEFKDYQIIVYENDSQDDTKEILQAWSKTNPEHIHVSLNMTDPAGTIPNVVSKVGANRFFCHKRIDKMARIRNNYMDYIEQHNWNADYLMVVDLDVAQLYLQPIINTLLEEKEWDAICAYGYSLSPSFKHRYHDTYALTKWEERDMVQTEKIIFGTNRTFDLYYKTKDWIRVASAFGGLAIYRFSAIQGLRYMALDNDDVRVEVRCEHFSIYQQMMERGYDKFFVVPTMELLYQRVTLKVILQKIRLVWTTMLNR